MRVLIIFTAIVAVATGLIPENIPTTCAATLCLAPSVCKEVIDPVTGVLQAKCIPTEPAGPSCLTVKCSLGQHCIMRQVHCFTPPCNPVPECVDTDKPGNCPAPPPPIDTKRFACKPTFDCEQDSDCDGRLKCCASFCGGRACRTPISTPVFPRSCDTHECPRGQHCVMQSVRCIRAPCPRQPTCVPRETRPGTCPKPSELAGICVFRPGVNCLDDSECRTGQKCCSEGCGRVCKDVIPLPLEKPGQCPAVRRYVSRRACRSTCSRDSDCSGDDKCCTTGCGGKVCQTPVPAVLPPPEPRPCKHILCPEGESCVQEEIRCVRAPCPSPPPRCVPDSKPGSCPRISFGLIRPACVPSPNCRSDAQCPGALKCCPTHCGEQCLEPQVRQTCASKVCGVGERCVTRLSCRSRPCSFQAVCEVAEVPRCPSYLTSINPRCVRRDQCSDSGSNKCTGGQICCQTHCGRRCVGPTRRIQY